MQAEMGSPAPAPTEILADVREAFEQFEDAISTADPARCRPYVSDQLYQDVVAMISDLSARGRRRVHGSFEIVDATLVDHDAGEPVQVRIHATSSIMELDQKNAIVSGSPDLMSWQQDLTVAYYDAPAADHHWIITALGQMSVEGGVSGPAGQPMDAATVQELDARQAAREQEADEAFAGVHRAHVSLMSYFQYHPF
jgi:hypothetical protein